MTLEEFLSGVRQFSVWVAENDPELNYIAGTGVALATDGTVTNHLLNTHANISQGALNGIASGWNYADAVCSIITVGELLLQNGLDEVNDKDRVENYAKAAVLTISATTLIAMTAAGMGPWGFAVATICDFGIASWDFYRSARKYWDFEYWLEEQLYELDYLTRKINEPDLGDKLHLEARKKHIIENIKAYATCHYHEKFKSINNEKNANSYQTEFENMFDRIANKFKHIKPEDSAKIKDHVSEKYIKEPLKSDSQRAHSIKRELKKDTQDKGVKLVLKTLSMVGMILIAVGASCHPVGLAITAGVAAGYLLYSFGLPAAKKLWNHCFNTPKKTLSSLDKQTDELSKIADIITAENFSYIAENCDKIRLFYLLHKYEIFIDSRSEKRSFNQYARAIYSSVKPEEARAFLDFFDNQIDEWNQKNLLPVLLDDYILHKDISRLNCYLLLQDKQLINPQKLNRSKINYYMSEVIEHSIENYANSLIDDKFLSTSDKITKYKTFNDLLIERQPEMMKFYLTRKHKLGTMGLDVDCNEFMQFIEHGLDYKKHMKHQVSHLFHRHQRFNDRPSERAVSY
ncbi:hypothetical protein L3V82_03630 [Thiotrichales bacterium 19S3-7]|nr:hypothetical protein [Thiotrichales bacterium 19S3-7]MCF6801262.1 hypothetical protein [Thiotrichales bacterium 19S3-11]